MEVSFFSVASSSSPRLRARAHPPASDCGRPPSARPDNRARRSRRDLVRRTTRAEWRRPRPGCGSPAPQRRDPVEARRLEGLLQAHLSDHAAVADQRHAVEPEALLELGDLACQRRRIADIAFEHFDRDRAAFGRAQKPEHDLQLAGFAVAIVAEFGERAGAPLEIGRGDVIEHQRAVLEVASRQCFLDALLLSDQPVERVIKRPLVDRPQFQHRAQRTVCRLVIEQARRCQLG
jgi:hypothetical protein